jgi:hypothetical protein
MASFRNTGPAEPRVSHGPLPRRERTIERLLSVDQTCRLQRRSLYGYLADLLTAKARGDPVPTLT